MQGTLPNGYYVTVEMGRRCGLEQWTAQVWMVERGVRHAVGAPVTRWSEGEAQAAAMRAWNKQRRG